MGEVGEIVEDRVVTSEPIGTLADGVVAGSSGRVAHMRDEALGRDLQAEAGRRAGGDVDDPGWPSRAAGAGARLDAQDCEVREFSDEARDGALT